MKPVPLDDAHHEHEFGGKAASLCRARRAGLPVPPGFALPWALVEAISAGEAAALAALRGLVDAAGGLVAVRSSAVGEDGASASFAGQHLTELHLRTDEQLLAAIERVWASACAASALAYRAKMGIVGPPRMGVVVQRLVDADCAGVLFTRHPITGADERVIEAAWGLGEIVVAGLVTPDHYRVARDGRVLERRAGEKDLAIRPDPDGGTREETIDDHRVHGLCLDDGKLARLGALAAQCEAASPGPHDLEWAFHREHLYLLQQRAITRSA